MQLAPLVAYLDEYLDIGAFDDASVNGLQVEASVEVTRLAVAVDASLDAVDGAGAAGAELLLCHHGLLWGQARPIRGVLGRRVRRLLRRGVSLYGVHLPLDAHPEVGNNAVLARQLALEDPQPFGRYRGKDLGISGRLPTPMAPEALLARLEEWVGPALGTVWAGPEAVRNVAVVSGAAANTIEEIEGGDVQLLITGEPDHTAAVFARDLGVHLVFLGHHATETFGVVALAEHLQRRFELPWVQVGRSSGF
jgi:dinuclear metal center YbgI/SA1388 family protein